MTLSTISPPSANTLQFAQQVEPVANGIGGLGVASDAFVKPLALTSPESLAVRNRPNHFDSPPGALRFVLRKSK